MERNHTNAAERANTIMEPVVVSCVDLCALGLRPLTQKQIYG